MTLIQPSAKSFFVLSLRALLALSLLAVIATSSRAQQSAPDPDPRIDPTAELHTFRLWEKPAPGALGDNPEDIPTLTLYPATHHDKPNAAIIVAPG
ncbi:MAG TPA: hypothetical protein VH022_12540, partial [Candidatus Acidoferrum sp.]|nr:hypothetical protein [Candidatus Acidoferrum sp.]